MQLGSIQIMRVTCESFMNFFFISRKITFYILFTIMMIEFIFIFPRQICLYSCNIFSLHLNTKSMIMNYSFLFLFHCFLAMCTALYSIVDEEKKDMSDDVERHMCFTFKSYTITASLDKFFFLLLLFIKKL